MHIWKVAATCIVCSLIIACGGNGSSNRAKVGPNTASQSVATPKVAGPVTGGSRSGRPLGGTAVEPYMEWPPSLWRGLKPHRFLSDCNMGLTTVEHSVDD